MQRRRASGIPWELIIILLILLPIGGIVLLVIQLTTSKALNPKDVSKIRWTSYLLFIGSALTFSTAFVSLEFMLERAFVMLCLVIPLIAGAIWVNRIASNLKKSGERYKKYPILITTYGQTFLDSIATSMGLSYITVEDDLQKMIILGYFPGAYIDSVRREIILPKVREYDITCKGCGAITKIPRGEAAKCRYCRLPLQ